MALINPNLVAAATPKVSPTPNIAQREANARAYAAAMREAAGGGPTQAAAKASTATTAATTGSVTREVPIAQERPRYVRPGSIIDIRV